MTVKCPVARRRRLPLAKMVMVQRYGGEGAEKLLQNPKQNEWESTKSGIWEEWRAFITH
jgi:hypothetical protein